jgi:hypothetical protein
VQAMWQEKARVLNTPLSAKGHAVGQRGAFTGLAIDTYKGRFYMLPDVLACMATTRDDFNMLGRCLAVYAAYHREGPRQSPLLRLRHSF